jgi:mono/diheme cytochrome c family protein
MANKLYLTQDEKGSKKSHLSFILFSTCSSKVGQIKFDKGPAMKKFLISILFTALILSACSTATPQATLTLVFATDTSAPPTVTVASTETTVPTVEAVLPTDTLAPQNTASNVSFASQVLPIFQTYCVECHGGARTREGLTLTTYDSLIAGSFSGTVLIPGNANDSLFIQLIQAGEMPNQGPSLSAAEIQILMDWVNQGALNN